MTTWINVDDQLPVDGERVLIEIIEPNPDKYDAATFNKGKVPKPSEIICHSDQHGNNLKPYTWDNPPMSYFGQDVTRWQRIEE